MYGSASLTINDRGHLCIGGLSVAELARQYGTPLYIMDEDGIRAACRDYLRAGRKHWGTHFRAAFAGKAFCTAAMYRLLQQEAMYADVVSGGELYTAHLAGFDMSRIYYHGSNKTRDELAEGLDYGIGRFVADNIPELEMLDALCAERGCRASVLLRITPGVEAHTHDFIRTGQIDSKFGLPIQTGDADEGIRTLLSCKNLDFMGFHCHVGSQILETAPFEAAAEIMASFIAHTRDTYGVTVHELNVGGGFGVRYVASDDPLTPDENLSALSLALRTACAAHDLEEPTLTIEPGRSIVAPYGITVYTVGAVKNIEGYRTYVSVNGGMTDNPRYMLYGAEYEFIVPDRAAEERTETVTVAGRSCESGDLLGENVKIQPVRPGDYLCTPTTGAYCYSMSSNYNRVPRPAVVFVANGKSRVVVRRETFADLVRLDVVE